MAQAQDAPPEKVHLIPDDWRIRNVGRLGDGRLFLVDGQLDYISGKTRDFVCTFLFDPDGTLVDHWIELIGTRGSFPDGQVGAAEKRHIEALGARARTDVWVRPFRVESHGAVFGFIPRRMPTGEWRVDFMPGNTLEFYPPWELGQYDT
jgi:hypothetical protein